MVTNFTHQGRRYTRALKYEALHITQSVSSYQFQPRSRDCLENVSTGASLSWEHKNLPHIRSVPDWISPSTENGF